MASTSAVLLLLSACLFTVTVGGDDCQSYFNGYSYNPPKSCGSGQHCCGTCDNRYCCWTRSRKLSETDQNFCNFKNNGVAVGLTVVGVVVFIIVFITCCCCCPCCCIYQMCRKPRPVVGTHVTAVTNMQCIQQQPVMQGGQYPQYQPVPQQGYSGQPMQTGPYQGQPYAPGPPPPYHIATSPGYPTSQSAYGGGQAMYPTQPPAQPSVAYMPSDTSSQPAYNPAYVQPPNTSY